MPSGSVTDQVSFLEQRQGVTPPDTASVSERLSVLEKNVFGGPKDGSLLERLEHLKGAISAKAALAVPPANPAPTNRQAYVPVQQVPNLPAQQKQYLAPAKNAAFADPEIAKIVQMLPLVNESAVNFVRMEPPNTNLDQVGDYFDTVTQTSHHRLLRFQHMPVPIYITPFPERDFMKACNGAFEMWEQRSNGIVRFTQVDDPSQARIRVVWSHLGMGQHPNDCVLGAHTITQWSVTPGSGLTSLVFGGIPVGVPRTSKYVVQPQIIEVNLDLIHAKPEELRLRLLRNVVAHELGHAVGLMGHSPQRSDLMNALTDECSRLSQRDVNTLRKLYNSSADIWL